jgi:hypothetical protein
MSLLAKYIDWLEGVFRTDVRYSVRGGFFLTLTQVAGALGGLVLTAAFANPLPVETYGTYRYILALYSLLAIVAMPGIDTAVTQSVARGYDSSLAAGIQAKLRWGTIGSLGALGYAVYSYIQGSFIGADIWNLGCGHWSAGYLCCDYRHFRPADLPSSEARRNLN